MRINEENMEYIIFTPWNKEVKYEADLRINDKKINCNDRPTFLGVDFDWNMPFKHHVEKVIKTICKRMRDTKKHKQKESQS